jgi:hypothetical protein
MGPSAGPKPQELFFKKLESKFYKGTSLYQNRENFFKLRSFLTDARDKRPSGYMSQPKLRDAYLRYYLPLHLPESYWALQSTLKTQPDFLKEVQSWKNIQDLGSGPATASLGVLFWMFENANILEQIESWHLLDHSEAILKLGAELLQSPNIIPNPAKTIQSFLVNLKADLRTQYRNKRIPHLGDLVILSHVFNELGNGPRHREKKFEVLEQLFSFCFEHKHKSTFVIIEPPLREPTLDLMSLRDQLAELEFIKIWGPCPSQKSRCPMALAKLGWCYTQAPRLFLKNSGLTALDQQIEDLKDDEIDKLSFSFLIFTVNPEENPRSTLEDHSQHWVQVTDASRNPGSFCDGTKLKKRSIEVESPRFYRGLQFPASKPPKNP